MGGEGVASIILVRLAREGVLEKAIKSRVKVNEG